MLIIRLEHEDFVLSVHANGVESTYAKARRKQNGIETATRYYASEGRLFLYDFSSKNLIPNPESKTHPLVFENKDYFLNVSFKKSEEISQPAMLSRLREIGEKIFFMEETGLLAGTINYNNDLGNTELRVQYYKANVRKEVHFAFEVFPTKLNFREDYEKMVSDIDREYPGLVLDFLKKTYSSFSTGGKANTDLIWWQVFGGLYKQFLEASSLIINKPHNRIVRQVKYVKADRILHWTAGLEEEFGRFRHLPQKTYRSEYKTLSTDTYENRFFKFALLQTAHRFKRVHQFILSRYGSSISDTFRSELLEIQLNLERLKVNPFFRSIGDFKGLRQESLVLQRAAGYSTIYRSFIMLGSGLKFLDGVQKIELKNIAELYQIWCFLEMKGLIQKILKKDKPDDVQLAQLYVDDFVFRLRQGVNSKVSFQTSDGQVIDLYHELSFERESYDQVKSFTVNQRPDIVLKITRNDLKENYEMTYLYDAKYRLASDEQEGAPDFPTEDSINQMHRYRDSIWYVNKESGKPEKEVIGAYILFPGSGNAEAVKQTPFYRSIASVNIGAFPLRPNDEENGILLENHIRSIISSETEQVLNELPPHKATAFEKHNPDVLMGIVQEGPHSAYFEQGGNLVYHSGKLLPSRLKNEDNGYVKIQSSVKYFAPYYSGKGVREYYEIDGFGFMPREDIFPAGHPLHKKGETSNRLVIRLGRKFLIDQGKYFTCNISVYRYTNLSKIRNPVQGKIEAVPIGS